MLGEFFAACGNEIDDALVAAGPYGRFPTTEAKGLSPVPIAKLGELLAAGSYDELVEAMKGRGAENGEAVLFSIPSQLRDALAEADDLDGTARRWALTEELSLSGWTTEAALGLLQNLTGLARAARGDQQELWYWWSL